MMINANQFNHSSDQSWTHEALALELIYAPPNPLYLVSSLRLSNFLGLVSVSQPSRGTSVPLDVLSTGVIHSPHLSADGTMHNKQ